LKWSEDVTKPSPRGVIRIKNEGEFWGVFIPKTNEFIVSKRMGDIKKVLFAHLNVEKMVRPDVDMSGEDEEYQKKVKELRKLINKKEYEEGELVEIVETVARFSDAGIPVKATADFFKTTQKRVKELIGEK